MTELAIECWVMKASFWAIEEYEVSTGRPRRLGGRVGLSSEGRIIRRGSGTGVFGLEGVGVKMYGTLVRDLRREM